MHSEISAHGCGNIPATTFLPVFDTFEITRKPLLNFLSPVSTLGALLSMGLQIGDPEEVAIAGLLRDVGIAELPLEIQSIPRDSLEANQLKKYMEHPKHSLKILKEKRLLLSERVNDMIAQHHEHFDGTGFPEGKEGRKIVPEAQILAIAEELDDILAVVEGRPRSSPKRAIEMVVQNEAGYPLGHRYDPSLLRRVVSLLFGTP
ncbi:MAG: HD domain-containing protein [Bdellovibrionales bacterium]|nr:HD domain-containing protein [Bdellovibrionales bacterium]